MIKKIATCACLLALTACASKPVAPPVVVVPSVRTVIVHDQALNDLLDYQAGLRLLPAAELAKAQQEAGKQDSKRDLSGKAIVRRAMLLAALHGPGDLGRAQGLLDGLIQSAVADDQQYKPLAQFLSNTYADLRRQDDAADKLNLQIRDAQRRNDQLNEKLEALKNIERSLSLRPPSSSSGQKP
jgi:peptidoglycan hydrolase CwlO-like protein